MQDLFEATTEQFLTALGYDNRSGILLRRSEGWWLITVRDICGISSSNASGQGLTIREAVEDLKQNSKGAKHESH